MEDINETEHLPAALKVFDPKMKIVEEYFSIYSHNEYSETTHSAGVYYRGTILTICCSNKEFDHYEMK